MTIFPSETRVYYNEDCQKYGVQRLVPGIVVNGKQLYKWSQVLIYKNKIVAPFQIDGRKAHCYTPYKKVAERWADSIREKGVIEVRADMEDETR